MLYSDSEYAWLTHRAELIAERTDCPSPIGRSEGAAEVTRSREHAPCPAIEQAMTNLMS